MESVMAGYVMAHLTHVPSLVAALPVAVSLPGVIFALPAGAVADATDRRLVLLSAKTLFCLSTLGLALIAATGGLTPLALLAFSAVLGTVATFSSPAWWATVGSLVPERLLSRALSLDGLQWNVAQIFGPVLGGVLLATIGAGGMFAIAGGLMTSVVSFLFVWRGRHRSRLSTPGQGASERVLGNIAAGARYLANAPALQVICLRTFVFVLPAGALADLLPLFASRELGLGAIGYGLLLSATGAGSVVGAIVLPRLHDRFHLDGMLAAASLAFAGCTAVLVIVHVLVLAGLAVAGTGAAWLMGVTALNIGAQEQVPLWVKSRALGAYLMVFQASIVTGGLLWGGVADAVGVRDTLLIASAALASGLLLVRRFGLPVVERGDMKIVPRPTPDVVAEPEDDEGPVMILAAYDIAPEDTEEFIELMEELRVVRRRIGASHWGLFEDASSPGRFLESFVLPSWGDYLLQRGRYTAADFRIYDAAMALHAGEGGPAVNYFIHPESSLSYRRRARWRRLRGEGRLPRSPEAADNQDNRS